MHSADGIFLNNVAAGTYSAVLKGGMYALSYKGTGTGTVDVKMLLPDGSTALAVFTQVTATTGFQTGVYLPPGSYQLVVATFSANYVSLCRVPLQ